MRWIWIDKFVEFQPMKSATTIKNVSMAEEHLHDHWGAYPTMPVSLMIEGMAQTGGLLVGQARDFKEKVILAKVSKAEIREWVVPGDQLKYHAVVENIAEGAASIRGTVYKNGAEIGEIQMMFSHIDNNISGRQFPKENFVFTDQFRQLLAPLLQEFSE